MNVQLRLAALCGVIALFTSACSFDLSLPEKAQRGAVTGSLDLGGHLASSAGQTVSLVDGKGSTVAQTTDAQGAFAFSDLMPGQYYLETKVPGFEKFVRPNIAVLAGQTVELGALKLEWLQGSASEGFISGIVGVNGGGGSAAGGQVDFVLEGVNQRIAVASVGEDGTFVQRLPPGTYTLKASHPAYVSKLIPGVTLADAEQKQLGETILLELNPATITGKVMKEVDGAPAVVASGVTVTAGSATSTSDQNGNFQLTGLKAGAVGVRFTLPGFHDTVIEHPAQLTAGQTTAIGTSQLTLDRGHITGRVQVLDTSNVGEVNVSVPGTAYTAIVSPDANDKSQGSFRISNIPAGTSYTVVASKQRYSSFQVTNVQVTYDQTTNIAQTFTLALLSGDFDVDDGDPNSLPGFVNKTTLTITLNNVSNAAKYRVSEDPAFGDMQTFANLTGNSFNWTLTSATEGTHTIYLQYQDTSGNPSPTLSTTLVLDTLKPTATVSLNGGAQYTNQTPAPQTLTVGVVGNGTGTTVQKMIIGESLGADGGVVGTLQSYAPFVPFVRTNAADGTQVLQAQVLDQAGNLSVPVSASIIVDTVKPAGTIAIRRGLTAAVPGYTNDDDVLIDQTFGAETGLLIRTANSSAALQSAVLLPVQAVAGWRLDPSSEGNKTVYAQLQDPAGNVSTVMTDSIVYDVTAPSPVGLAVLSGAVTNDAGVTLQFTTPGEALAPDAGVVLAESLLFTGPTVQGPFGFPSNSRAVFPLSSASDGLKTIYARFNDLAGNSSVAEASVTLDRVAPSGTISLSGTLGDGTTSTDRTSSASVTLALNVSGATGYLLGNASLTSCPSTPASYTPLNSAASLPVTLTGTTNPRVVRICLRDDANNLFGPLEDTIDLDGAAPSGCTLSLEAQRGTGTWLSNGFTSSPVIRARFTGCSETPAEVALVESATAVSCAAPTISWAPFADPAALTLIDAQGSKDVYACVRDATRNVATLAQRTIVLDKTAPTLALNLTTTSPTNGTSAVISVSAADTGGAAFGSDALTASEDGAFASGLTGPTANATSLTVPLSGGDGQKRIYVRARDRAGNETVDSVLLTKDTSAPSGSLTVYGTLGDGTESATVATATAVSVALSSTDATEYALASGATCPTSGYAAITAARVNTTLSGSGATRSVSVCFRDAAGNVAGPISDTISFDSAGPSGCVLALEAQRTPNQWSTSANTPAETLRARFSSCAEVPAEIVLGEGTLNCASPALTWKAFEDPSTFVLSTGETTKNVLACVRDSARNPVALTAQTIRLDKTAPALTLALTTTSPTNGGTAAIIVTATDTSGSGFGSDALTASEDAAFATAAVGPTANTTSLSVPLSSGDGQKRIYIRARDNAGNETVRSVVLDRDTAVPSTGTVLITGALGDGTSSTTTATSTTVSVALSATDATEYLVTTAASCPTSGYSALTSPITATLAGTGATRTVSVCFRDGAGNVSAAPVTDSIGFDNTAPAGCGFFLEAQRPGSTSWSLANATADETIRARITNCSAADLPAEMVIVEGALSCSATGLAWQSFADPSTLVLSTGEGNKTVRACVRDAARNSLALTPFTITLDETAPTLTLSLTTASPTNGGSAAITVTAADTGGSALGADALTASEDSTFATTALGPTANATSLTVPLSSGDGTKRIYVRARDGAGNETVKSVSLVRDTQAPASGSVVISGLMGDGSASTSVATSTAVTISLSATDATEYLVTTAASCPTSGYSAITAAPVSTTLSGSGATRTVSVCFRDAAGNVTAAPVTDSIGFDNAGPTACALSLEAQRPGSTAWLTATATADETVRARIKSCTATDLPTEMVVVEGSVTCSAAGLSWQPFADPVTLILSAAQGSKSVSACVRDSARNAVALTAQNIFFDETPPTLSLTLTTTSPTSGATANITVAAADTSGSGLGADALAASEDGAFTSLAFGPSSNVGSISVPLSSGDGQKRIYVRARDAAGNDTLQSVLIDRDTSAPATNSVTIYGTLGDGATESSSHSATTSVQVQLTAADATEYAFTTSATCPATGYATIPSTRVTTTLNGTGATRTVSVCFKDTAGNISAAPVTDSITFDNAPPTSCTLALEAQRAGAWTNNGFTNSTALRARLDCTENPSTVAVVVDGTCAASLTFVPFASTLDVTIPATQVAHTVTICARDTQLNTGAIGPGSIILDTTAPAISAAAIAQGAATPLSTVTVTSTASDSNGLTHSDAYTISEDVYLLASPIVGPGAYQASSSLALTSGDGVKNIYLRVRDVAGNETFRTLTVTKDSAAPTGSFELTGTLASGAPSLVYTTSSPVTAALSVSSDVVGYTVGDATLTTCPTAAASYTALNGATTVAVPFGSTGLKTVRMCFRDAAGNVSATYAQDTITYDNAAPSACALSLEAQKPGATNWTAATATASKTIRARITGCTASDLPAEMVIVEGALSCTAAGLGWQSYADNATLVLSAGENSKTVRACVRDAAGNSAALTQQTILLDETAPTLTLTLVTTSPTKGASANITVLAGDGTGSGLGSDALAASEDGAFASLSFGPTSNVGSITVPLSSGDGQKRVYVRARDAAGNETIQSVVLDRDTAAPSTGAVTIYGTLGDSSTESATYSSTTAVQVQLSATDAAEYAFTTSASCPASGYSSIPTTRVNTTLNGSGATRTVSVCFKDSAGNITSAPVTDSITFDNTPPTSCTLALEAQRNGAWNSNGFSNSTAIRARLDCTENPATMAIVVDGSCTASLTFAPFAGTADVTIPATQVSHSVTVCARDAQLNTGAISPGSIILDTTAPAISAAAISEGAATSGSSVTITSTASDSNGLTHSDAYTVSEDVFLTASPIIGPMAHSASQSLSLSAGDGTKTIYVRVRDIAGNETFRTLSIVKDTSAPSGSFELAGTLADGTSSAIYTTTATVTATLTLSADATKYYYSTGALGSCPSTTAQTYTALNGATTVSLNLGTTGAKTVKMCFADAANNVSAVATDTIEYDNSAPAGCALVLEAPRFGDYVDNGFTNSRDIRANVACTDTPAEIALSATTLATCSGTLSWVPFQTYSSVSLAAGDGTKAVSLCARDAAKNTIIPVSTDIQLDTAAPTSVSASISPGPITAANPVTVTVNATDSLSGLGDIDGLTLAEKSSYGDGTPTAFGTSPATPSFTLSGGDGLKTVYVRVRDIAGNQTEVQATVTADTTGPTTADVTLTGTLVDGTSSTRWTRSNGVTVTLANYDGATQYAVLTGSQTCATAPSWTSLPANATFSGNLEGTGLVRNLRVCLKDAAGNVSSSSFSDPDGIQFDSAAPTGCVLTIVGSRVDGSDAGTSITAQRSITAFVNSCSSDATEFFLVPSATACGANVSASWLTLSAGSGSTTVSLINSDGPNIVAGCVRDDAHNITNIPAKVITLDTTSPVAYSLEINNDEEYINRNQVLDAGLKGFVEGMATGAMYWAVSDQQNSFTNRLNFAEPSSVTTFNFRDAGVQQLYAQFWDEVGNASSVVTDNINIDVTPPSAAGGSVAIYSKNASGFMNTITATLLMTPPTDSDTAEVRFGEDIQAQSGGVCDDGDFGSASWEGLSSTHNFIFGSTEGLKRVCAQWRDLAGNTSSFKDDVVTLDMTAPLEPQIITESRTFNPDTADGGRSVSVTIAGITRAPDHEVWEILGGVQQDGSDMRTWIDGGSNSTAPTYTFNYTLRVPDGGTQFASGIVNVLRVREKDRAGNAGPEAFVTMTADNCSPQAPKLNKLWVSNSDRAATLYWRPTGEPDVVGYNVYYATSSGIADGGYNGLYADQGASPISVGNVGSLTLSGLPNGVTTYTTVRAVDHAGNLSKIDPFDPPSPFTREPQLQPNTVSPTAAGEYTLWPQLLMSSKVGWKIVTYGSYAYVAGTVGNSVCNSSGSLTAFAPIDLTNLESPIAGGVLEDQAASPIFGTPIVTNDLAKCGVEKAEVDLAIDGQYAYLVSGTRLYIYYLGSPMTPVLVTKDGLGNPAPIDLAAISPTYVNMLGLFSVSVRGNLVVITGRTDNASEPNGAIITLDVSTLFDDNASTRPAITDLMGQATTSLIQPLASLITRNRLVGVTSYSSLQSLPLYNLTDAMDLPDAGTVWNNADRYATANGSIQHSDSLYASKAGSYLFVFEDDESSVLDMNYLWNGAAPDAGAPFLTAVSSTGVGARGIPELAGQQAFVPDVTGPGLKVLDLTNIGSITDVGTYRVTNSTQIERSAAVYGNYVLGVTADGKLRVYEAATPRSPHVIGTTSSGGPRAEIGPGFAYNSSGGLLDLYTGLPPQTTGTQGDTCTYDVARMGESTMVVPRGPFIRIWDLKKQIDHDASTVPVNARMDAGVAFGGPGDYEEIFFGATTRVTAARGFGRYLILSEVRSDGIWLEVFDAATLLDHSPTTTITAADRLAQLQLSTSTSASYTTALTVSAGRAFVGVDINNQAAGPSPGLFIVDLRPVMDDDASTTLSSTHIQGSLAITNVRDMAVSGTRLFVATLNSLKIVDISKAMDDDNTTLVPSSFITGGSGNKLGEFVMSGASSVAVHGSYVFVTPQAENAPTSSTGLYVLDVSDPTNPVVVSFMNLGLIVTNCNAETSPGLAISRMRTSTIVVGSRLYVSSRDSLTIIELE